MYIILYLLYDDSINRQYYYLVKKKSQTLKTIKCKNIRFLRVAYLSCPIIGGYTVTFHQQCIII